MIHTNRHAAFGGPDGIRFTTREALSANHQRPTLSYGSVVSVGRAFRPQRGDDDERVNQCTIHTQVRGAAKNSAATGRGRRDAGGRHSADRNHCRHGRDADRCLGHRDEPRPRAVSRRARTLSPSQGHTESRRTPGHAGRCIRQPQASTARMAAPHHPAVVHRRIHRADLHRAGRTGQGRMRDLRRVGDTAVRQQRPAARRTVAQRQGDARAVRHRLLQHLPDHRRHQYAGAVRAQPSDPMAVP